MHAFYITRISNPSIVNICNLFKLVDEGEFSISEFAGFQYGRPLDNLATHEIIKICTLLENYGKLGIITSFTLITQYCYFNNILWDDCKMYIKKLIYIENLFIPFKDSNFILHSVDHYHLTRTVEQIIVEDKLDVAFIENVSKQIHESSLQEYFSTLDSYIGKLCAYLVQEHFNIFWSAISKAFISNSLDYLNLKFLLGNQNGDNGNIGILFSGQLQNLDTIFNWCKENSPIAPYKIAYLMPITTQKNGVETWHPFAKRMIDEFGALEHFMGELGANLGSFSFSDIRTEKYYLQKKSLIIELQNHPIKNVKMWAKNTIKYSGRAVKADLSSCGSQREGVSSQKSEYRTKKPVRMSSRILNPGS